MVLDEIHLAMANYIDHSLYPDMDQPPDELADDFDKADYLHRVCTAWDFGIMPDRVTFAVLSGWRNIFDRFPVLASPAYHALRARFGWPAIPWPNGIRPPLARWELQDQLEGRDSDPCAELV
jgi:hypothetical protein